MARKKKAGVPDLSEDAAEMPVRPTQKAPERLASPFAAALAGVKAAPPRARSDALPAKGARSFAEALASRGTLPASTTHAATPSVAEPARPRSFSEALEVRERGAAPEAKAAERSLAERTALRDAFAGVKPLGERDKMRVPVPPPGGGRQIKRGVAPDMSDPDAEARQRLAALVAGGLRFSVAVDDDGRTEGTRIESGGRAAVEVRALARLAGASIDAELDLHGKTGDEAELLVAKWIRARHKQGARVVRLVHGKGLHSDSGGPVLRDRVIRALTEGGAAPLVLGFVSCAPKAGGTGALAVQLAGRV